MKKPSFSSYREYEEKYSCLVELEREKEMERHRKEIEQMTAKEREEEGRALLYMKGKHEGKALGGKHIVKFTRKGPLSENEISVGDLVMISKNQPLNPDNPTGTVTEKTHYSISVAFQDSPPGFTYGKNLRIDLYVNDITFQRMLDALDELEETDEHQEKLKRILLDQEDPLFTDQPEPKYSSSELDESQKEAVKRSLEADNLFLVHGPPGTGKTTTLIEIIERHVEKGDKVLATADSNVAVDNMVDFLIEKGRKTVRVGHPARVTELLREHTLDYIVQGKEKYKKAQKFREKANELDEKQEKHTYPSGRWRRGLGNKAIKKLAKKGKGSRGIPPSKIKSMAKWIKLQDKIGDLIDKAFELEEEAVDEVIQESDVVVATNSTAGTELIKNEEFDVAVIDEATQATEPSCLIPIAHVDKVIMAGDHKQLPPTILSQEAKNKGLEKSLFERMLHLHGPDIKKMLHTQFRMNTDIMDFSSKEFYDGEIKAAPKVANHTLNIETQENDFIARICNPEQPVTFLDTTGKFKERTRKGSTSKENPKEAKLVEKIVKQVMDLGVEPEQVGVISPYDDQVDLLQTNIKTKGLEINTVDGFQGREKDVIILSFVRSNPRDEIGFLKDLRRLNVSITRARKKLIAIGDSNTLKQNETYSRLLEYFQRKGKSLEITLADTLPVGKRNAHELTQASVCFAR